MADLMVAVCPECGRMYQKHFRQMCHDCSERLDRALNRCIDFLKKNKYVTVAELSSQTEVEESRIKKWIREQKILLHDYPNMAYDCELCAAPIRGGRLCLNCSARLKSEIARMKQQEEAKPSGTGFHSRPNGR